MIKKINPIERAEMIKKEYKDYLKATLSIGDPIIQNLFLKELDKAQLFKGPYMSFSKPFKTEKTMKECIDEGILSKDFSKLGGLSLDFRLYEHQYQSLIQIASNRSIVVTTGTGSGKTESFLYPIINDIMKDIEAGKDHKGIRALFLYPVNALVNDQIQRLRDLLRSYPQITFGSYTGETEEDEEKLNRREYQERKKSHLVQPEPIDYPPNEIRDRDSMRANPPHLLFTNYSMLEYILIRPSDQQIFDHVNTKNWKFIVLDEAHTYKGALAIELSHLLRRLSGKFKHQNLQYILTSATLGKENLNTPEIIDFAHQLTGSEFTKDQVIYAKRVELEPHISYSIDPIDYLGVINNKDNVTHVSKIISKYRDNSASDINELVFDWIRYDAAFNQLIEMLKFDDVYTAQEVYEFMREHFMMTIEQFTAFIDLLAFGIKGGQPLINCKYHVFISSPEGAFIKYKPNPYISLKRQKEHEGGKLFELGVCRFCSSTYLIGHIMSNEGKFIQNDKVDIYENYGETKKTVKTDFLLLEGSMTNDVIDEEELVQYELCTKCGNLRKIKNVNGKSCSCEDQYKMKVYHANNEKSEVQNNIQRCPVCDSYHVAGVVRAFHIQKDEATAIIGQIALSSMYDYTVTTTKDPDYKKQFIAFSDSVQQASFYATFMEHNHMRFLRKKAILEILDKYDEPLRLQKLVGEYRRMVEAKELISPLKDHYKAYNTEALATILAELLKVDGKFSGEGIGLYAFRLNQLIPDRITNILTRSNSQILSKTDVNQVIDLVHIAIEIFRTTPAIYYDRDEIDIADLEEELLYRSFDNYVTLRNTIAKKDRERNNVRSYMPTSAQGVERRSNALFKFIGKILNTDDINQITQCALEIWDLCESLNIFEHSIQNHDHVQINIDRYSVVRAEQQKFYRCDRCYKITPNNVGGHCHQRNCEGHLNEITDFSTIDGISGYYRKQYLDKQIERIIVEEHTSQIGKRIGRVNQNLFKQNKINVLSSSTTFEMGIDIGSLDNVFMRNVPPTPANYAQRAGRAGRRFGNAGFVITYCDKGSHDFTYFSSPKSMIKGVIKPPYFKVNNTKIIMRHITASTLGSFFAIHPEYFKIVEPFVFGGGIEKFIDYIKSKPLELGEYIDHAILTGLDMKYLENFGWTDYVIGPDSPIVKMVLYVRNQVEELETAINDAKASGTKMDLARASWLKGQQDRIKDDNLLQRLSRSVVVPKYGFPVDVVELEIFDYNEKTDMEPSRDLSLAISEYAPESEVVINKKKYTSRYVIFPPMQFDKLESKYYVQCPNCQRIIADYNNQSDEFNQCPHCYEPLHNMPEQYIVPSYGFASENKTHKSKTLKPKKTYSSQTYYVGGGVRNDDGIDLGRLIHLESSTDDELMSVNNNPFYVCSSCGYTKIDRTVGPIRSIQIQHSARYDQNKTCKNTTLYRRHLAHTFKTDVIKFTLDLKITNEQAISTLYALLNGISTAFNIERNDINGVYNYENTKTQFILFDQVPGGAGHVKRLLDVNGFTLAVENALESVSHDCCDLTSSCYSCLRNYRNQQVHDLLRRGLAKDMLTFVLNDIYQNGSQKDEPTDRIKQKFMIVNKGTSLEGKTLEQSIKYATDDFSLVSDLQIEALVSFIAEMSGYPSPDYFGSQIKLKNGEILVVDLLWNTQKVMMVFDENNIALYKNKLELEEWNIIFLKDKNDLKIIY